MQRLVVENTWILLDNLVLEVGMKEEVDFCNFATRTT